MYAVHRQGVPPPPEGDGASAYWVFSDRFEPHMRMRMEVKALGLSFTGEAARTTRYPYEGRAVVEHTALMEAPALGRDLAFELRDVQRWDGAGGLVHFAFSLRMRLPGLLDKTIEATAEREGEFMVMEIDVPGQEKTRKPLRLDKDWSLSGGIMEPAPVAEMRPGARWTERTFDHSSGGIVPVEIEVTARGEVEIAGRRRTAFRAVERREAATGRTLEFERWYDAGGRALRQEMAFSVALVVLERLPLPGEEDERGPAD
jgi:hypothetical protein